MVVSNRDRSPSTPEVQDASEGSWANPHSVRPRQPKWEAYVTVDTLKNLMSTITVTIMQQVTEQVKKAMEARSHHHSDREREAACPDRDRRSGGENREG